MVAVLFIYLMQLKKTLFSARNFTPAGIGLCIIWTSVASANNLRIVIYNISAGTGAPGSDLTTVLQAIGNSHLSSNAQPIDVLALQELSYSSSAASPTLQSVVTNLNNVYGAGTYAYDPIYDPTTGGTGGGPSGLIYNTKTVQDLGSLVIGVASGSGAPRAPIRYNLQPIGGGSETAFYLYVSHAKSGTTQGDKDRRNFESQELRSDTSGLGSSAHIIYAGDFNLTGSTEASYQTLIASGIGQAKDPVNPAGNWTATSAFANLLTESATNLRYRDDFQFVTAPMLDTNGLHLVSESYSVFGNDGSTAYGKSVNLSSNTALSDLTNRLAVLSALTTVTDHLPVVADYSFTPVGPPNWASSFSGNWSSSGNWTGSVPNAVGAQAAFDATQAVTVILDAPQTVGELSLAGSSTTSGYKLAGATLTLSNTGGNPAVVTVASGSQTISAPIVLAGNLTINDSGSLTLSGCVSESGSPGKRLTLAGNGQLILAGTGSYTGGTTVSSGTLAITSASALPSGYAVTIGAGATMIYDPLFKVPGSASSIVFNSASYLSPDSRFAGPADMVAVPEPASLTLLLGLAGCAGAVWLRRRVTR